MEEPRLSSSSGNSNADTGSTSMLCSNSDSGSSVSTLNLPYPIIQSAVINEGGTAMHVGDLYSYTVNTYIVDPGDEWNQGAVKQFVTDAVHTISKTNPKSDSNKPDRRTWYLLVGSLAALSFLTLFTIWLLSFSSHPMYAYTTPGTLMVDTDDISDHFGDLPGSPRVMPRVSWVAAPPSHILDNNTLPIKRVIVCHTATESCDTTPKCIMAVRYVQQFHMQSREWDDIGYNFVIGGDGCVYEGRGWNKMGAHTKFYNNGSLGVAFLGTFINETPNLSQVDAFHKLIAIGVKIGKIAEDYTLAAQCQLQVTAAPGLALVHNMTSWPHYDTSLPVQCTPV